MTSEGRLMLVIVEGGDTHFSIRTPADEWPSDMLCGEKIHPSLRRSHPLYDADWERIALLERRSSLAACLDCLVIAFA